MKKKVTLAALETLLRDKALSYPETHEDFPWGESAIKVKGKAFLFMRRSDDEISFSVKLPHTRDMAVDLPFAEPTHYGLGKHGWVTAKISKGAEAPAELFLGWLDESFRAVAPKKLLKDLDAAAGTGPEKSKAKQKGQP